MIFIGICCKMFFFDGIKYVKNNFFGEIGFGDIMILFVIIYQGNKFFGKFVGKVIFFVIFFNFMKQLVVIEVMYIESKMVKLKWVLWFCFFFIGSFLDIYSFVMIKKIYFDFNVFLRMKRFFWLNGKYLEVYKCIIKDKVFVIYFLFIYQ